MENCDKPLADLALGDAVKCGWDKGAAALTTVVHAPGSATITDWALALLAVLILVNLLFLLVGMLVPRRL